MYKGEGLAGSDCAAERVGVAGADQRCHRLYDGVIGSGFSDGLFHKPTELFRDKGFHKRRQSILGGRIFQGLLLPIGDAKKKRIFPLRKG